MALNSLYGKGRSSFLDADIDWSADNIKAVLVDAGAYTVSINVDQFLSDIPGGARIATSANLTSKTSTLGVADADDVTFSLVTGVQCEAVVLYQDTGVAGTSRLILYSDTMTGLPVTPSGGDIVVRWDNGANKIFKL
jgi:hypothetical protein